MLTGPKHRILVPFSFFWGGTFLILCDTLARTVSSQEIPVGIITAVFGGTSFYLPSAQI
ncbi:iron chelate uptake ABC transporter family permease subunit [Eubacterium callanderi]|uniref:iron chelate uptake ABC transporter family permease subunit n=1 Tax=Eubacterium callanderi TaxID=53442 RepID=UPI0020C266D3|nr:iron chelate uptake ABC transporter family permease subunit [Eubacterium callanderi]